MLTKTAAIAAPQKAGLRMGRRRPHALPLLIGRCPSAGIGIGRR